MEIAESSIASPAPLLFILLQKWGRSMQRHFKTAFLTGSRFLNRSTHARSARLQEEQPPCPRRPTPHPCYPCHLHPWLPQKSEATRLFFDHIQCGHGDRTSRSGSGWPPSHSYGPSGLLSGSSRPPGLCLLTCLQPWGQLCGFHHAYLGVTLAPQ